MDTFPEESESTSPDPHELLRQAEEEPHQRALQDYGEVISKLKDEKRFTFREIADWLTERGVKTDHNAVWRAYTKHMHPADAADVEKDDNEIELEEVLDDEEARK
jgi:transposase-like protein